MVGNKENFIIFEVNEVFVNQNKVQPGEVERIVEESGTVDSGGYCRK